MIEKNMTYDLLPGVDMKAYSAWAKKTVETMTKQPGVVEFRANRNVLGGPLVRVSVTWKSLTDWGRFAESEAWRSLEAEMHAFATNVKVELWGPSPILPEPVRPAK